MNFKISRRTLIRLTLITAAFLFYSFNYFNSRVGAVVENPGEFDEKKARLAFLDAYKVFSSARCINCHPAGDAPLQTENSQPHAFLVERGEDGRGFTALRCTACHQEKNSPGEYAPPGARDWHLPPPEMKMTFQGISPKKLCEQLKNPKLNGGRNLQEVGNHLGTELVRWAWSPGGNRQPPPLSYEAFIQDFEIWRSNGGACPE